MPTVALVHGAQHALLLAIAISVPVLSIAGAVGLLVAALQAASQIQDPTLAHFPRLLAIAAALAVLGPWMGHEVTAFARQMFAATSVGWR